MFSSNFIAILLKRLLHYQVGLTFTGEPWSAFTDDSVSTEPSGQEEAARGEEGRPGRGGPPGGRDAGG